jgi:Tfp pilus assembly protein PilN
MSSLIVWSRQKLVFLGQTKSFLLKSCMGFFLLLLIAEIIMNIYSVFLQQRIEQQQKLLEGSRMAAARVDFFTAEITPAPFKKTVLQNFVSDLSFLRLLNDLLHLPQEIYFRQIAYQVLGVNIKGFSNDKTSLLQWSETLHQKITLTVNEMKAVQNKINFNVAIK